MALGITMRARAAGADQVLFAPGGSVQETGASNFMLLDDARLVTKALDGSFLVGVTRDSVLALAREPGYRVEERDITVDELFTWAAEGEVALVGTAAVMAGVGNFLHDGQQRPIRRRDGRAEHAASTPGPHRRTTGSGARPVGMDQSGRAMSQ